jgi:hypothetical protein
MLGEMAVVPKGIPLGDLSIAPEHRIADPAIWWEWLDAIEKAESGKVDVCMRLTK